MSDSTTNSTPVRPVAGSAPTAAPPLAIQRQFVNFAFFKLDGAFRRLPVAEKGAAREEFLTLFSAHDPGKICLSYSTVGLRADCDFLLWRIAPGPDDFQAHTALINKSRLGAFLTTPWSFVSMTKRSMYIDKLDPFHTVESRTHIMPGQRKFLFVYPFVKTRDWYLLSLEERQKIMDVHIRVGNEFPSVKLNTTYSFGLDDQEFVVAFETESPADFLDLVMKLRETQSSKYTLRDTPIFTCVQMPLEKILDQLF
jgi:chlorite dismutase